MHIHSKLITFLTLTCLLVFGLICCLGFYKAMHLDHHLKSWKHYQAINIPLRSELAWPSRR